MGQVSIAPPYGVQNVSLLKGAYGGASNPGLVRVKRVLEGERRRLGFGV
jgi:hypothetical protein